MNWVQSHLTVDLGNLVIQLLKMMLEPDPNKRLTAAECLDHPFFKGMQGDEGEQGMDSTTNSTEEFITPNAELGKLKDK